MATDGPTPMPCDPNIFQYGSPIALIDGSSSAVETWVKEVRKAAQAQIDWHYSGGIAQVIHLGDKESRQRVGAAINSLASKLNGTIMRICSPEEEGLYRKGVTDPGDSNMSFMNPFTGEGVSVKGIVVQRGDENINRDEKIGDPQEN
jgi:hypothetical protein